MSAERVHRGPRPLPPSSTAIAVDDPWRAHLRAPVFGTMAFALLFVIYAAPLKETPSVFDHAPWLNDPFDTVITFMMLFVPLIAALCLPRVLRCRRHEVMAASRIRDILRGCRVVAAGISTTLAAEWVSVGLVENRSAWNGATGLQIGLLALMSAVDAAVVVQLGWTRLPPLPADPTQPVTAGPDWLGDGLSVLRQHDRWFGPLREPIRARLARCEASVRRHPVRFAAAASAVLGAGVGINQALQETYTAAAAFTASTLLAVGMFGLLVVAGRYLGLVRSSRPWHGAGRRLVDAAVVASVGVLVPFALRYHLWWAVGTTNARAGIPQLAELLAFAAAAIFCATLVVESLLGMHPVEPEVVSLPPRASP